MARADTVEYANDGRVVVVIENERYTLKRPKVGEYRKLREALHAEQDEQTRLTDAFHKRNRDRATAVADALKDDTLDDDARAELTRENAAATRDDNRQLSESIEESNERWVRQAFSDLGDKALPEDSNELPLFMRAGEFVTRVIDHWRSVP